MLTLCCLAAMAFAGPANTTDQELIARAEHMPWRNSAGELIPRVQLDAAGNAERLSLGGMNLSADEFAALGQIKSLRYLSLYQTNVTDADLHFLRELPELRGLNLTSTEITDAAIDELIACETLQSLCLGNVAVTPEAVARLRAHFEGLGRRLALGYNQRQ